VANRCRRCEEEGEAEAEGKEGSDGGKEAKREAKREGSDGVGEIVRGEVATGEGPYPLDSLCTYLPLTLTWCLP
jgi:hypothetical protein